MTNLSIKHFFTSVLLFLLSAQSAFTCKHPFPFTDSKKVQEIRSWAKQDMEITKEQIALQRELRKDEERYWKLKEEIEPLCVDGQGNSCIEKCQVLSSEQLRATIIEDGYRYVLPKAKREELKNQQDALETKWMKKQ